MSAMPEKLNLWDRLFNRYTRKVIRRGRDNWQMRHASGEVIPNGEYARDFVEYEITDRLTGSQTIERIYLTP